MKVYRADLHIHSVLSPCGELEMSPANIIAEAQQKKIDIIAITDHNSTRQAEAVQRMGAKKGITVLLGAEVNTKEEVHVLCFLPDLESRAAFQEYIDEHLPQIKNKEELFGYQVVVNEDEEITYNEPYWLLSALNQSIEQVERKVHELNGIFIPAHIERSANGLMKTLGMMPDNLKVDALEYSYRSTAAEILERYKEIGNIPLISCSDAHRIEDIGRATTTFKLKHPNFEELKMALNEEKGRGLSKASR